MRTVAISVSTALLLAACGGGDGAATVSPTTPIPLERPTSTAELRVVSPENGEVVRGSTVELEIELEGATIVPQTVTELTPDTGHLHVLLDEQLLSMTEGLSQTIPEVEPGQHLLQVEFVAADHAPFDPRVVVVVAFEVRE